MNKESTRNIRVGILVIAGALFLIFALYTIGKKQNIFGNTFRISARFYNVNGLMSGNNVRFSGIDVGTVERVDIISDSSVNVVMIIEEKVRSFIKKNAVANVGTDGLMGNKLVNINSGANYGLIIEDGDVLRTLRPVETDEMLRTLNRTNDNVSTISENLKTISEKVNSPNTLWSILMDTVVAENVKQAIVNIKTTGSNASKISKDLGIIVQNVKLGKGSIGSLLSDTSFSNSLHSTMLNLKTTGDSLTLISGDLRSISQKIKNGEGTVGMLLSDTSFVNDMNKSIKNIKDGSQGFNDNMEALKHNFLFRRYFKNQEKKNKK